jgi:hypothetical protein
MVISLVTESVIKRWKLHSFDFAFGLACGLGGKGKCVQCALAIEFFRAGAFFLFFFLRLPLQAMSFVVAYYLKMFVSCLSV